MRLLLDTHFLVWLVDDPTRLRAGETELLFSADSELAVSAASIWEIRLKWRSKHPSGDDKLSTPPDAAIRLADALGMRRLAVTMQHAAARLDVPLAHKDPFDEILLIQAQVEDLRLLTRDRLLRDHPLALSA